MSALSGSSRLSGGDTIFARASGAGKASVAVYRLSGPQAVSIASALCSDRLPPPRIAAFRRFATPDSGATLDEGLVILFVGPASFTGEDVVEFQVHGSAAVEKDVYAAFAALGARPAEPGEFTRRALANGKLDLAQVEGLGDLLDAETSLQRVQALGQLDGRLSERAGLWRRRLIEALSFFEASIDFADEADAPDTAAAARAPIEGLLSELRAAFARARVARTVREGFRIALVGAPNAGKSSLLNRLAGDERAIVSSSPGTTRDVVEARLDLGGRLVTVADTAGLRAAAADPIEAEGMKRSLRAASQAHLRLIVVDPLSDVSRETMALAREGDLVVFSKIDLADRRAALAASRRSAAGLKSLALSSETGEGFDRLAAAIGGRINAGEGDDGAALTRERHVRAVTAAIDALERARERLQVAPELAAEDVRIASRSLGQITGAVDVEEVLGEIFSTFCIGK